METVENITPYTVPEIDPNSHNEIFQARGVGGVLRMPILVQNELCELGYAHFYREDLGMCNALIVPAEASRFLPEPHRNLNAHYYGNDQYYFYNATPETIERTMGRFIINRSVKRQPEPQRDHWRALASAGDVADALNATDPERILFYTGAGMSAVNKNVWTFATYKEKVGISEQANNEAFTRNVEFADSFLRDESTAYNALQKLSLFASSCESSHPTRAHENFTQIMQLFGRVPLAATTNIDWLHQRTGLDVPFLTRRNGMVLPYLDKDRWFARALETRIDIIEKAIIIGRSSDTRGLISAIRARNPSLQCVALNNDTRQLPYLEPGDYILPGSCQETIPELYQYLV